MPRKRIQKLLPNPDVIMKSNIVTIFGPVLNDPSLWHINRRSCSGAFAVGLFFAFIPVPFQMILAAFFAILFRVNILISVPLVWITNPITIPPFFYFCYLVGVKVLGIETGDFSIELSIDWWLNGLMAIWQPLLLGSLIVASTASFLGYTLIQLFWRYHLWQHLKNRKHRKQ